MSQTTIMGHDGMASHDASTSSIPDTPSSASTVHDPDNNNNNTKSTKWNLWPKVEEFRGREDAAGFRPRELGVTWQNLTVKAISSESAIHENVASQFNVPKLIGESRRKPPLRTILDASHGCVKPGEMLLVLGRPGSGCTTLLKLLANRREGFASVSGDVHYGSMDPKEAQRYRGQIVMNTEDELFFPSLTVGQTMDYVTRLKVPAHLPQGVASKEELRVEGKEFLMEAMHIQHTKDTKVGNEYIRGVSGGERKRVSIIETMVSKGSVFMWDNSTRGLDASTALDYTKAVRAMTTVHGLSSIVTLYQAGNGIYDLFDKVLVLDGGKQIYYGPMLEARPFMEQLGFICSEGANVADFLTGVTVPTERQVRPGYENVFPRNATALREIYSASTIREKMEREYAYPRSEEAAEKTRLFKEAIDHEKDARLLKSSPLTVGFAQQVKACVIRQYQIILGDTANLALKHGSTLVQALIAGSLFYNAPGDSSGLFIKGGALFFALLYSGMLATSEVNESFVGRPVLAKHKAFAFVHPAAFCIAQISADLPILAFQISFFSLVLYFMTGLEMSAGAFFTFWIVIYVTALTLTAFFRWIGSAFSTLDNATKVSGFGFGIFVIYAGFMIQKPQMHPWFEWLFWINPMSYALDAVLSNEFHGKTIDCVGNNLVPQGPSYTDTAHQSCTGVGGQTQGLTWLTGDAYLRFLHYDHANLWRNFGILWAWWLLFAALTIFCTSRWKPESESGPSLLIPRERAHLHSTASLGIDEESQVLGEKPNGQLDGANTSNDEGADPSAAGTGTLIRNKSVFTWNNLSYTVSTPTGERTLLNNVKGWVKPGMLGALMGSSGAGKTTLLDVLAQRKTQGTIHGSIQVDGRPLPVSFQRSAGYCEQLDVHEEYATVREALEFSALLRQPAANTRAQKLAYVDTIIELLELHDMQDTLIGRVGAGLSVEQRKRVTIGVELVAKPSILIFLDEPTSGLDGQSAFNTVRFLRKLAAAGQAVLVTIHQPSAQLFAQFDTLLLLAAGGKTVYFGDIGADAQTVRDYFGRHGAPCPRGTNPAEHMIDVVSGLSPGAKDRDWHEVWLASREHAAVEAEVARLIAEAAAKPPGTVDDGRPFATTLWEQTKIVTRRMNYSLYRNTEYVNNKVAIHVGLALFNGFTFWMIGDGVGDLQMRLFSIFCFILVIPGTIQQTQPLFLKRRAIFEAREKKSKMYSWVAFVTGLIVSEIPYLVICAALYFVCWYYTVGFPAASARAGGTFYMLLMSEFFSTGFAQFVAAYAPNDVFAALANPLLLGVCILFCGVLVPYAQITPFWRYWAYWLNPFNYIMGGFLVFAGWDTPVTCTEQELAVFDPPAGATCAEYLADYQSPGMAGAASNLLNPNATAGCQVCAFSNGSDWLRTLNLNEYSYAWRDAGITTLFVFSSFALVYLLMKLRTKASKRAE